MFHRLSRKECLIAADRPAHGAWYWRTHRQDLSRLTVFGEAAGATLVLKALTLASWMLRIVLLSMGAEPRRLKVSLVVTKLGQHYFC